MKRWMFGLIVVLAMGAWAGAQGVEPPPWQRPYRGQAATGQNVIALWHFDQPDPAAGAASQERQLKLRGQRTRFTEQGRFGGGVAITLGENPKKQPHGVIVPDDPALSPDGAFTLEMWIQPSQALGTQPIAYLADKKAFHYTSERSNANQDYLLALQRAGQEQLRLSAHLGFGEESKIISSSRLNLSPGQWHHVALTYDGQGHAKLYLDGAQVADETWTGYGPVSAGDRPLVIGGRGASNYFGFPGVIDEVRLSSVAIDFNSGRIDISRVPGSRNVFYRLEDARIHLQIANGTNQSIEHASLKATGEEGFEQTLPLPVVEAGKTVTARVPIATDLRAGEYVWTLTPRLENGETIGDPVPLTVTLMPRPLPHQMPVFMWGHTQDHERLLQLGFTHQFAWLGQLYQSTWKDETVSSSARARRFQTAREELNNWMAKGLKGVLSVKPAGWVEDNADDAATYYRINREDEPYDRRNACCLFPRIQRFSHEAGKQVSELYGDMPALDAVLIHGERRDGTAPCFHEHDREAYHAFSGQSIPAEVARARGVSYRNLPDFPSHRVIADDHPLLTYYRWFWKQGDGWNKLNTLVAEGLEEGGDGAGPWTFHAPSVRVPSIWSSGGAVDFLGNWTYTYPNPLKTALATDQLFAMAQGRPGQQVMGMTQIIWYRRRTAPENNPVEEPAAWEKQQPDARFVTIAPDHLREALWMKLARPIDGLMYHGWTSLVEVPNGEDKAYRYTHSETQDVLQRLIHEVVEPLGPTLLQVPDVKRDVAYLESFASQMFAGRGTYGWGTGWGADAYFILRYAQLQPRVIYAETIRAEGLDQYEVLVLANCDVLTRSVADAIQRFQDNGGIVIADERLTPAIAPDILLPSYKRTGNAEQDKAALLGRAAALREQFDPYYDRYVTSSDPEVLVHRRRYGQADYVFVINDRRTFGDYVGQHGLVMEKGMPAEARVTVGRPGAAVYALPVGERVATESIGEELSFDVSLEGGEGQLFLVTPHPIDTVRIEAPRGVGAGEAVHAEVYVVDAQGRPIEAVIPLHVRITDAQGRPAEFTGYYGAKDGRLSLRLDIPANAQSGEWQIQLRDLAAGQTASHRFIVEQ